MSTAPNIVILQNTEVGSTLPLSIFLTHLLKLLDEANGLDIHAIVGRLEPNSPRFQRVQLRPLGTKLYSPVSNVLFFFRAIQALRKISRTTPINIIHCFYPNSSLLAAAAYKLFGSRKTKIIYEVRSPWIEMLYARKLIPAVLARVVWAILHTGEFLLLRFVNAFVFITDGLAKYYQTTYRLALGRRSVWIIPSGFDHRRFRHQPDPEFRKSLGYQADDIVLVHIGGMARMRQLPDLIDFFHEARRQNSCLRLLFIGEGEVTQQLQIYSRQQGEAQFVRFIGLVPHDLIPRYLSISDVGISHIPDIAAYRTSFPLKILEYLGCGLPVAATQMPAHEEIARTLHNVFLYQYTGTDFATTLASIPRQTPFRDNDEVLANEYSWHSFTDRYLRLYHESLLT